MHSFCLRNRRTLASVLNTVVLMRLKKTVIVELLLLCTIACNIRKKRHPENTEIALNDNAHHHYAVD